MSKLVIVEGSDLPVVVGRGRRKGQGKNLDLLAGMKPGQQVWDISDPQIWSIASTASRHGYDISVRRIPDTDYYMFQMNGRK